MIHYYFVSFSTVRNMCSFSDPSIPTNFLLFFPFWILHAVFSSVCLFNATASLQSLKVLHFNASVTIFFHKDDCRLPGKLLAVSTRVHPLVPFLDKALCSLRTGAQATEAFCVHFFCGCTTHPRVLLWLEACLLFFPANIKKTSSATVSPNSINRLRLALNSP